MAVPPRDFSGGHRRAWLVYGRDTGTGGGGNVTTGRKRLVGSFLFVLTAFNTACYSFVPVASGVTPKVGDEVRVHLNATGTAELAQFLGPAVEYAEGTLSAVHSDGSIVVGVGEVRLTTGSDNMWNGQSQITFATRHVAEVQLRQVDRSKTRAALIGGGLAIVAIFAIAIGSGGTKGQPDPVGGGQPPP